MVKKKEVVLGVTGSIAAFKACDLVTMFKKAGSGISVIMTEEAKEFVSPLTFRILSGNKVFSDLFSSSDEWDPLHISLAEKADVLLIAPATANIIGKIAAGIADDILTATVLATRAPVVIAPAMNEGMFRNNAVQANIAQLKKRGYYFVGPVKGRLASGAVGLGRLAPIETIFREVKGQL